MRKLVMSDPASIAAAKRKTERDLKERGITLTPVEIEKFVSSKPKIINKKVVKKVVKKVNKKGGKR